MRLVMKHVPHLLLSSPLLSALLLCLSAIWLREAAVKTTLLFAGPDSAAQRQPLFRGAEHSPSLWTRRGEERRGGQKQRRESKKKGLKRKWKRREGGIIAYAGNPSRTVGFCRH